MERSTNNIQTHSQDTSTSVFDKFLTNDVLHHDSSTTHEKSESIKTIISSEDQRDITIKDVHASEIVDSVEGNRITDQQYTVDTLQESLNKSTTMTTDTGLVTEAPTPPYDLSVLWDKHCEYEFSTRDVDATMATMVADPYVNHIPTMTGGVGVKELSRFYKHHFINSNPEDIHMIPISRVVGTDRVVDEMLCCFTHDREIDWILPGIAPTGKPVKIPLVAIVAFRDGKLYNEHIYWDQASVLVQIGLLDSTNLPVAGVETANKLLDKNLPSNTLMKRWVESADKS